MRQLHIPKAATMAIVPLFFLFALATNSQAAGPWYVSTTGSDSNDCLTPATACGSINHVLNDGGFAAFDTIYVARGTYTGTAPNTEVVLIDQSVDLSGGWKPSFTSQDGLSTIDAEYSRRGARITGDVEVEIDRFFITKGSYGADGGGIGIESGIVTISNSTISGNSAFAGGGILNLSDDFTLVDSIISDNSATAYGGGIANNAGAILTMSRTSIRGNSAGQFQNGGGIYNFPMAFVYATDSELSNNDASAGGAIYNDGDLLLTNTTISGNVARSQGGGIYHYDQNAILTLNNVTISNNVAEDFYGGLYGHINTSTTMRNTIIADNDAPNAPNCQSLTPINSGGYNLIGDPSMCSIVTTIGDILDGNPAMDALADNGGSTRTQALYVTSEAVDAGDPGGCRDENFAIIDTDQRGTARPQGAACDIGAYEGSVPAPVVDPADFFPLDDGNQWTYLEDGFDTSTATVQAGTVMINGVPTKELRFVESGEVSSNYFTNDANGIRLHRTTVEGDSFTLSPPIVITSSPSSIGQEIQASGDVTGVFTGIGTFPLDYDATTRVLRQQTITVPAGTYDTVKVEVDLRIYGTVLGTPINETEIDTYWLTEYVGPVKSVQEFQDVTYISELTSSNIDWDGDGVLSYLDNCPGISDPNQANFDGDTRGDICDADDDNDGYMDTEDAFPFNADEWLDTDGDGIGNNADNDDDADGIPDNEDDYPLGRFNDVPPTFWAYHFIDRLAAAGVTAGCGNNNYCPSSAVTRAQMAVFLERGMNGSGFRPPAATGNVFLDVGATDFAASFIEQLAADGITAGCGGGNYCPIAQVTRDQMAVFLLRAKYGSSHSPPTATGVFADVPLSHWAAPWIEQLADEGITAGCGGGNYCPGNAVTRDQMAVFLVRTFGL
ncbi:MAG: S-layer homology domain-containing protein [Gammaproteobacteria bacterium]|nr:S-layer homology domain-containing protein [Woeseia sp.]MBU2677537.1 S-layer homology domain-containing protein [Gammaproteobacteria bacterium]NNL51269.1 hypothetical protein [Woeseiaceae bacterium]